MACQLYNGEKTLKTYEEWKAELDEKVKNTIEALKEVKQCFEDIKDVDANGVTLEEIQGYAMAKSIQLAKVMDED